MSINWIWGFAGAMAYILAIWITKLFLSILRKKYKFQDNSFFWYDPSLTDSFIDRIFPNLLFLMFFLGTITAWAIR